MWPFKKAPPPKPTPELKQFGDIRPEDFDRHPVWVSCHSVDYDEPWYDDSDEETFRPFTESLPIGSEEMYLVRCSFSLSDGSTLSGFATPAATSDDWGTIQPQAFLDDGRLIGFWLGILPKEGVLAELCLALGKSEDRIFPISFSPAPGLTSAECGGTITGFMVRSGASYKIIRN